MYVFTANVEPACKYVAMSRILPLQINSRNFTATF